MKAIQLGAALGLLVGALVFVLGGGTSGSITGEIFQAQDTTQGMNDELHNVIQTRKEELSKRFRELRFPDAVE